MKTKVITEPEFIVKSENKVVVCKMKVDLQLYYLDTIWGYTAHEWWKTKAPMVNRSGEFIVTAKARCNSEDTFDEEKGKKIAESRAKAKAFKIAKNVWNCIAKSFIEKAKIAEVMTKNCAAVEEIEVNHVKKLSE